MCVVCKDVLCVVCKNICCFKDCLCVLFVQSRLAYDKKQLDYERNRGQSEVEDKKARKKCQAAS